MRKKLKGDKALNQTTKFKPYPYINNPKETRTFKRHELDRLSSWAAFLAHPYLDLPEKNVTLAQHEIDTIYLLLENNHVLLHTLNYFLSSKHYLLEKTSLIRKLVERNKSFSETYEFTIAFKQETLKIMKTLNDNGVETVFIKSLTEIPLDSSNFDILVKKQYILKAKKILEDLGFIELTRIREYEWGGSPHKFLYRKLYNGLIMSIHLHTQVAWEGVKFADETKERARFVTSKAWRFVGEMKEISSTFQSVGLPGGFHEAAANIYTRIASFKDAPSLPAIESVLQALKLDV